MKIIGYTYEADAHCVDCAKKRQFKLALESLNAPDAAENDEHGVPVHAVDCEGNLIRPIFENDEQIYPLYCGDCHAVISAAFRPGATAPAIDPENLYWASFNRFELRLPGQCVIDCAHSGPCDSDVESWIEKVRAQIEADNFPNKPTPDAIRAELEEYGAWELAALADDEQNFRRLIWIAAGNIKEDKTPDCSDPAGQTLSKA